MSFLKEKKITPRGFTAHDELKIAMESFLALDEFQKINNLIGILSKLISGWNFSYSIKFQSETI